MASFDRSFRWLLVLSLLFASSSTPGCADDEQSSTAKEEPVASEEPVVSKDGDAAKNEPDLFAVPEGTARELFLFINEIKQRQPSERTQEAIIAHLKKQVAAVMTAADRILAGEVNDEDAARAVDEQFRGLSLLARFDPESKTDLLKLAKSLQDDPRPTIVRAAEFQLLQQGVFETLQSPDSKESIVTDIFAFIEKYGLDDDGAGFAAQLGQALGDSQPEISVQILSRLVPMLEDSDNPDFQALALEVAGTLRRLNLPGKFMELHGITADGTEFDWESYRGKFVLIDFWATWCGPCRAEIPNVKKNLSKYGEKGFQVVGVNLDQDRADFDAYMQDAQLPWQNIMPDENGNSEMATRYAITGIPTVILVDTEGKVISMTARGPDLGRLLETHLGVVDDTAGAQ
ncbi:MAG: TlpA disulfide reductase family protein [Planctomycetaceae bacterium]|jgi:thiol-disulfide isomerase/thioredoxin